MVYSNCISASHSFPFSQSPMGWPVLHRPGGQIHGDCTWVRALTQRWLIECWQDLVWCCLSVLPGENSLYSRAAGDLFLAQDYLESHLACLPCYLVCSTRLYGLIWRPASHRALLAADQLCFLSLLNPKSPHGEKSDFVSWKVLRHF